MLASTLVMTASERETNDEFQAASGNRRTGEAVRDGQVAFKARNGRLPNPDSDAGRAVLTLGAFAGELKTLQIGQLVYVTM